MSSRVCSNLYKVEEFVVSTFGVLSVYFLEYWVLGLVRVSTSTVVASNFYQFLFLIPIYLF